jgi:S1-C subfamily serine protease
VDLGRHNRPLPRAAELLAVAVAGAGLALGAAALFGGFGGSTTTVREIQSVVPASSSVSFAHGKALSIYEVFKRSAPGVVQVTSTQVVQAPADPFFGNPFGQPQTERRQALGSGFVIDKAGHIVTNYHVVQGARQVEVSFSNNESVKAQVVGTDPSSDLAVLQVKVNSRALTPLSLGDSDGVRVGDSVVAIGNPFGLDRTVTAGIVSALQRQITSPNEYAIDHVIQTDAPINHGNSGGPLLNAEGQVIGVNSQIETGSSGTEGNVGIGFAIPSNTVKTVVAQLINNGKVEHAYLGIEAVPITPDLARVFRLPVKQGLVVEGVRKGSGAAKAGLKAGTTQVVLAGESYLLGGDVIVKADGVHVASLARLRDLIAAKRPGDTIELELSRGNSTRTVEVKLGRQPPSPSG